jgi:uncharacterized protein YecE (DUF72 family)
MESKLLIGTSGYSYPDWVGILYPMGVKQADYLSVYAKEFNCTEINYTYYKMPTTAASKRMVQITDETFRFSIKAHQSLTHEWSECTMSKNVKDFIKGIEPVLHNNKLSTLLLQFPFSFHYSKDCRHYLGALCDELKEIPLSIEFRNQEWQKESVYNELRNRQICFVNVDEPAINGLLKPDTIVTSDIGYVRFHGRNTDNWWSGDNVTRYDYSYNDKELTEWVNRIMVMMNNAKVILIVFNNHSKGQAVENARRLKELLVL